MPHPCFTYHIIGNGCAPALGQKGNAMMMTFLPCNTYNGYKLSWDFGNNITSQSTSPVTAFSYCGTYTVTLTITDTIHHIIDTAMRVIRVACKPIVSFTTSTKGGCDGTVIDLRDSVNDWGYTHTTLWSVGTGTQYYGDSVKHMALHNISPTGITFYSISLHVTSANGCSTTVVKDSAITISIKPQALFSTDNYSSCTKPASVNFINQSSSRTTQDTLLNYLWMFPGGAPAGSSLASPNVYYTAAQSYTATLIATNIASNCSDTFTNPQAVTLTSFTHTLTLRPLSCTRDSVLLIDTVTGQQVRLSKWYVSPSNSSQLIRHGKDSCVVFTQPGLYSICQQIMFTDGCTNTVCQTVNIISMPKAKLTASTPMSCSLPQSISLSDVSVNSIYSKWSAPGSIQDTAKGSPVHFTYSLCGTYKIVLTAADSICTDTTSVSITIPCYKIHLSATGASLPGICSPATVGFTTQLPDSGYAYLTDTLQNIISFKLYFKDSFSLSFDTCAVYKLHVYMHNATGCADSAVQLLRVAQKPVINAISFDTLKCFHDTVCLKAQVSGCAVRPLQYTWFTQWPGINSITTAQPVINTLDTGYHTIALIVNNGCTDTFIAQKLLYIRGPIAAFAINYMCTPYDSVQVNTQTAVGANARWTLLNTNTIYTGTSWAFSTHTCGNFPLRLSVYNNTCADSVTDTLKIRPVKASFTPLITKACPNTEIPLVNTSTGCISNDDYDCTWFIDQCDGTTIGVRYKNGIHDTTFLMFQPGINPTKLIQTAVNGCADTSVTDNIYIYGLNAAIHDSIYGTSCLPINVYIAYDAGNYCLKDTITQARWQLYRNNNLIKDTFAHNPVTLICPYSGCYVLKLSLSDKYSCVDTVVKTIGCFYRPQVSLNVSNDTLCRNTPVNLSINKQHTTGVLSAVWDFGDGDTAHSLNPAHVYQNPQSTYNSYIHTFHVTATVTDSLCDTTLNTYITVVYPRTNVHDILPVANVCPPLKAVFVDSFNDYAHRYWQFGAAQQPYFTQDDSQRAYYTYFIPGTYNVRMIGEVAGGCADTVNVDTIHVKTLSGKYSIISDSGCVPFTFIATAVPYISSTTYWVVNDAFYKNTDTIKQTITVPGTYTAQVVFADTVNNCSVAYPVDTFYVWPLPQVAGIDTSMCYGDTVSLRLKNNLASALQYKWSPSAGLVSTNTANPLCYTLSDATYMVDVSNIHACSVTDTIHIHVWPLPVITTSGDTFSCVNTCVPVILHGAVSYAWHALSYIKGNSNPLIHCRNVPGIYPYYIRGYDVHGCSNVDSVYITTYALPITRLSGTAVVCFGDTVILHASGAASYTFISTPYLTSASATAITISPIKDTLYSVAGFDAHGCGDTTYFNTSVVPKVHVVVTPADTAICKGAFLKVSASGGTAYDWYPVVSGVTNQSYIVLQPQYDMTLYVRTSNTCFADTGFVNIRLNPIPAVSAGPDKLLYNGTVAILRAQAFVPGTYTWQPASSLVSSTGATVQAEPAQTTVYTVTFTDASGCIATDSVKLMLVCGDGKGITVPNCFTPTDPHGTNMVLRPYFYGNTQLKLFRVYDRWGQLMYETHENGAGWDGTYQGKMLDQGVYAYYLEALCPNGNLIKTQGNITLLR